MNGENKDETFLCGCGYLLHVFNISYRNGDNVLYINISTHQNKNLIQRITSAIKLIFNKRIESGLYDPILVNNSDLKRMYNICERIAEDMNPVISADVENERYRLVFTIDSHDFCRVYIEIHQKNNMPIFQKIKLAVYYVLRFQSKYEVEKFQINTQTASYLKGLLGYTHLLAKDLQ